MEEGLGSEQLERKLAERKFLFEAEKYRALGRGAPFSERQRKVLSVGKFKLTDCQKMSLQLGLVHLNGMLTLTKGGKDVLALDVRLQKERLGILFLDRYSEFANLLYKLNLAENDELAFPDIRHSSSKDKFRKAARPLDIDVDGISFNHMRDLLTQVGYVNWFPTKKGGEPVHVTNLAGYLIWIKRNSIDVRWRLVGPRGK